jgi:hypothetical protein
MFSEGNTMRTGMMIFIDVFIQKTMNIEGTVMRIMMSGNEGDVRMRSEDGEKRKNVEGERKRNREERTKKDVVWKKREQGYQSNS